MIDIVSAFQLGSSTVVTLPKKLGIKPGQKLELRKLKDGATLKLETKRSLLEVLQQTRGTWADMDWKTYDQNQKERRKFELAAARKMKKAW